MILLVSSPPMIYGRRDRNGLVATLGDSNSSSSRMNIAGFSLDFGFVFTNVFLGCAFLTALFLLCFDGSFSSSSTLTTAPSFSLSKTPLTEFGDFDVVSSAFFLAPEDVQTSLRFLDEVVAAALGVIEDVGVPNSSKMLEEVLWSLGR